MIIQFNYEENAERTVSVEFGPWPKKETYPNCPSCGTSMEPETLLLRIQGHGSIEHEILPYTLLFGTQIRIEGKVGCVSVYHQKNGFHCPNCGGFWLPGKNS